MMCVSKRGKCCESSVVVKECQICDNDKLGNILFLGYMPPVNKMHDIGKVPEEQASYPALLLFCPVCGLVQLGLIVDSEILFPKEYPYTGGTTKILRDNFKDLYEECSSLIEISSEDLVVDIGSNDGTLLGNFVGKCKVQGITPEEIGKLAVNKGIPTLQSYFSDEAVQEVIKERGKAKIVTATNVFAHIKDVHDVLDNVITLMKEDGVFISESHYIVPLIETLQYDTIYHEHLRYYSIQSLKYLFDSHGLEIFHIKRIPTHGGSIRIYAAKRGARKADDSVGKYMSEENTFGIDEKKLFKFKREVVSSKIRLYSLLDGIKKENKNIYGIGAPSRASTLINYTALDDGILDCVLEVKGSYKIGKYIPGTLIPILEESELFEKQPDYALILSWHISDELMPKLKEKGFKGDFIIPLPEPRIVRL